MIDAWDPSTFSEEVRVAIDENGDLVVSFYAESDRLMQEHLNSDPYQSLGSNRHHSEFYVFLEEKLTPILARSSIRAWHYARLTDQEIEGIQRRIVPTSLEFLRQRLDALVANGELSRAGANRIFEQSPLHAQPAERVGRVWTTTTPCRTTDSGVRPLLGYWGGESAYFWLEDEELKDKLARIGIPRVMEIETSLSENLNAFGVARTCAEAWAKHRGRNVVPSGSDLSIAACIDTARVLHVHSKGDALFDTVGLSYPEGCLPLLAVDGSDD